ncbi:MAG: threonine/serine dehydratase [Alphaproteobacteria bacterium]|nr:MAG: threonine/serine dehydratase [Alphaproteobacteria bacterium]
MTGVPSRADIRTIHHLIRPYIRRTPCLTVAAGDLVGHPLCLKLEHLQHAGSFKARGAFAALTTLPVPAAGVIAASGGNHGIAVATAARRLGHRAQIFVPALTSAAKLARLVATGAEVVQGGASYAEALAACTAAQQSSGALSIHAYDQTETLAGQGTLALEWQEQAPDLDTLIIAVGGGGLIGGALAWHQGATRIIAVEPEGCPTLHHALAAGAPTDVSVGGIAADALGAKRIGSLMFPLAQAHLSAAVLVPDQAILAAQQMIWARLQLAAEPAAATALAALITGAYRPRAGERVGVLLCGGNLDPAGLTA